MSSYRRLADDYANAVVSLLFFVVIACCCLISAFQSQPEPVKIQLPTTEEVGESAGRQAVKFAKGFAKGVSGEVKP